MFIQKDVDDLKVSSFSRMLLTYVLLSLTAHFDYAARYDYDSSYFVGRRTGNHSQVCSWFPLLRQCLIVLGGRMNVMD